MDNFKLFVLFIAVAFIFISCKEEEVETTQICVLLDVTDERFKDENFVSENTPKLLELMKLNKQSGGFSGAEIKISLINEVSDSKSRTIKINVGDPGLMGENPLNRKDEVNRFCEQLESSFSQVLASANWGTQSSKIYQKVSRECIKMHRSEADRKYLIIYSDMLENSDLFTFYGNGWQKNIEKMMEAPEVTLEKLSKNGPALPDLSEFEIYIITTRTSENDEKINISEQFWTKLFEHQGAVVRFGAGLEV